MCTLCLYASCNIGKALLLTSIFNSSSPQLIHACSEALKTHIFCIYLCFVFTCLYISGPKGFTWGIWAKLNVCGCFFWIKAHKQSTRVTLSVTLITR